MKKVVLHALDTCIHALMLGWTPTSGVHLNVRGCIHVTSANATLVFLLL